ncbi:MAG: response regulator transcription factor [Pedosphaera sp.]|nr:response regulator transcription factor [Pedosphaera sp.]
MNTILVIDDQPQMRRNLLTILEMEGFQLLTADNGRVGLKLAQEELPDLILCDIMMPELDGYAVLQALRADKYTATIPFIFLTAKGEKADLRAGMNLGADDYLTKPVAKADLLAAIAARFERERLNEARLRAEIAKHRFKLDFTSPAPLRENLALSGRAAEVLLWVAQGKSNADVGAILGMSEKTVKKHLGHIFEKLGVESRTAATLRALEALGVQLAG